MPVYGRMPFAVAILNKIGITCIYWLKGKKSVRNKLLEVGFSEVYICVITCLV
jgi:hypothetical protein